MRPSRTPGSPFALCAIAIVASAGACTSASSPAGPRPAAIATPPPAPAPSAPPSAAALSAPAITTQPFAPPTVSHGTLPNGMAVWHVGSRTLPTVHLRLVVRTSPASPAASRLTALAVERGRYPVPVPGAPKPVARTFRADMEVRSVEGAEVFALELPRNQLDPAVDHLGAMVRRTKLSGTPMAALRALDEARSAALLSEDPCAALRAVAVRELNGAAPGTAEDATRITAPDLEAFHKTRFVPRSTGLIVTGDVTFDEAMDAARRAFGTWEAPAPPASAASTPSAPQYVRIVVVDRPKAPDHAVVLAAPGAAASAPDWAALWLLRDRLAPQAPAPAQQLPRISGELPSSSAALAVCSRTPADRTSDAVASALERARSLVGADLPNNELRIARDGWIDRLATELASMPDLADFAASAFASGLEHDAPSLLPSRIGAITAADVRQAARARLANGALVVVLADAERVGVELSRFGDVTVLDPSSGFARKKVIPADPRATAPAP